MKNKYTNLQKRCCKNFKSKSESISAEIKKEKLKLQENFIERKMKNKNKKMTICELVQKALTLTNELELIEILLEIQNKAGKMEDRLLKYCNSIEDLGFERIRKN